jgi:hypothetical protein
VERAVAVLHTVRREWRRRSVQLIGSGEGRRRSVDTGSDDEVASHSGIDRADVGVGEVRARHRALRPGRRRQHRRASDTCERKRTRCNYRSYLQLSTSYTCPRPAPLQTALVCPRQSGPNRDATRHRPRVLAGFRNATRPRPKPGPVTSASSAYGPGSTNVKPPSAGMKDPRPDSRSTTGARARFEQGRSVWAMEPQSARRARAPPLAKAGSQLRWCAADLHSSGTPRAAASNQAVETVRTPRDSVTLPSTATIYQSPGLLGSPRPARGKFSRPGQFVC